MNASMSRVLLSGLLAASLAANGVLVWRIAHPPAPPPKPALAREFVPYAALGSMTAENNRIADLKWTEAQFAAFVEGLRASYEGRGYPQDDEAKQLRADINARVQKMIEAEQPDPTEAYFRTLREKENVQRTASGLHYRITHEGDGPPPKSADTIVVSYAARTPDGKTLETLAGVRLRVKTTDLLPGLAEGVQLLKSGGKALFFLPAALSFGAGEWPKDVPPGMPIGFFLELHEVIPE
jgi:FKBP-type peptidyl-prolyl cis-trans isomerase FkpA